MCGCAVPAGEPELRHDASLRSDEAANLIEIGPLVVGYGEGGKRDRMSEADNRSAGTPTLAAILNVLFKKADMPWPLCSFGPAIRIIPFLRQQYTRADPELAFDLSPDFMGTLGEGCVVLTFAELCV